MQLLKPSQVRARILSEHEVLRRSVDRLAAVTARLLAGDCEAFSAATASAQLLYQQLQDHLDFEDALLVAALRDTDAWGNLRADRLASHHVEQRQQFRTLAERSRCETPAGLAALLTELIADLRLDMQYEEKEVLSPELLRDDVLVVDNEGG
jgi:iron-sulfur cluster repair protein YtfE (RIC family)